MKQLRDNSSFAPFYDQGLTQGKGIFAGLYQLQRLSRRRCIPVWQPAGLLADFLCRFRIDRVVLLLRVGMFAGRGAA